MHKEEKSLEGQYGKREEEAYEEGQMSRGRLRTGEKLAEIGES